MPLIFATEQDAARALREAGLKATPQRLAVLRSLSGDETHPTAQELHERLAAEFPSLSVATIYNTLSALTRIGRCIPLELGGPVRFDPNVEAHDHAVCEQCGSIRDVNAEQTFPAAISGDAASAAISGNAGSAATSGEKPSRELTGFTVRRVERIYRGLCALCTQSVEARQPKPRGESHVQTAQGNQD
ncbi:MAG TPA: Fur family transcriptional regulator [Polyangiales bacterium]